MFEEFYTPLPDLAAYLERIGESQKPCSLEALDSLILSHQKSVPFENLDQYYNKTASSSIEELFDKIVTRKRGGYCFEQNALFVALLESLGYKAYSGDAKIIRGKDISTPILILHRVNFVEFEDGLYFCDVGYGGPMPSFALKVEDGSTRSLNGETFHIHKADGDWWKLSRTTSEGLLEDILIFRTKKVENCDFFVLNYYASTSPLSVFTNLRLVNRRLDNGNVSITNDSFTKNIDGKSETITLKDDDHFLSILKEYFLMDYTIQKN